MEPRPAPSEAYVPRRIVVRAAKPEPSGSPEPSAPIRRVVRAAEAAPSGSPETSAREGLLSRMGHALEEKARPFGRSVADFALHGAVNRGLSMGSRELAKGILSWSGLAGAVGGGVMGTMATGAFVGAIGGALVEYARQVGGNLDRKAEADPSVAGRKAAFLLKFKELRHTETLKPTDLKRIRNAAIFGAIAGAGAGALMEHTPIGGLIKERIEGLGINFPSKTALVEGVKNLAGGAKDLAGGVAGGALHGAGEFAGGAGQTAGNVLGGVGEFAGGAGELTDKIPGVAGAKETIGHRLGLGGVPDAGPVVPPPDAGPVVPPPDAGPVVPPPDAGPDAIPDATEPLSPTIIHGHEISGSVVDQNLTFDNEPWNIFDNSTKNIGQVLEATGKIKAPIDQQALAAKLQQATSLWANGQLNPSTNPDLYRLFHLSNGTESIYQNLLNKDTLASLQNLGIVGK